MPKGGRRIGGRGMPVPPPEAPADYDPRYHHIPPYQHMANGRMGRHLDEEHNAYDSASRYGLSRMDSGEYLSHRHSGGEIPYSEKGNWGYHHPGDYYNYGAAPQAGYVYPGYHDMELPMGNGVQKRSFGAEYDNGYQNGHGEVAGRAAIPNHRRNDMSGGGVGYKTDTGSGGGALKLWSYIRSMYRSAFHQVGKHSPIGKNVLQDANGASASKETEIARRSSRGLDMGLPRDGSGTKIRKGKRRQRKRLWMRSIFWILLALAYVPAWRMFSLFSMDQNMDNSSMASPSRKTGAHGHGPADSHPMKLSNKSSPYAKGAKPESPISKAGDIVKKKEPEPKKDTNVVGTGLSKHHIEDAGDYDEGGDRTTMEQINKLADSPTEPTTRENTVLEPVSADVLSKEDHTDSSRSSLEELSPVMNVTKSPLPRVFIFGDTSKKKNNDSKWKKKIMEELSQNTERNSMNDSAESPAVEGKRGVHKRDFQLSDRLGEEQFWDTPEALSVAQQERITIVTMVTSEYFHHFQNWLRGIESLDDEGIRKVPADSVRVVVVTANITAYHRSLLAHGFLAHGRARPESIVHLRSPGQIMSKLFTAMPMTWQEKHSLNLIPDLFDKAPRITSLIAVNLEFGHDSTAILWFDPNTLVKGPVDKLAEAVRAEGVIAAAGFSKKGNPTYGDVAELLNEDKDIARLMSNLSESSASTNVLSGKFIGVAPGSNWIVAAAISIVKCISGEFSGIDLCLLFRDSILENALDKLSDKFDTQISTEAVLLGLSVMLSPTDSEDIPGKVHRKIDDLLFKDLLELGHTVTNLIIEATRYDMWGHVLEMNNNRQAINLTGPVHEAEVDFLKGHIAVTFVVAIESDPAAFNSVLELVNNVGTKERGTKRGNVVGLGSYDRAARVAVYNLGLSDSQYKMLSSGFNDTLGKSASVVHFEEKGLPSHCIARNDKKHTNCYKVVIIADAVERFGGFVLWLEPYDDKKNKISVKKPLDRMRELMLKQGICSPHTGGTMESRTMPETLRYLGLDESLYSQSPLDSRILGIDTFNETIVEQVLYPWLDCAKTLACIAPDGASKSKHQYEQSALSALTFKAGILDMPNKKNDIHIGS